MKTHNKLLLGAVLMAASLSVSADTIGYWRFESAATPGFDSNGSGRDLAPVNSPEIEDITDAGAGQGFFAGGANRIPQNQLANASGVRLWGTNRMHLVRDYEPAFLATNQFTIEAFLNPGSIAAGNTYAIASRFGQTGAGTVVNPVSWVFAVRYDGATPRLRLTASRDGIPNNLVSKFATTMGLQLNHDYYVALVFNSGYATFYLADLATNNPTLLSETVTVFAGNNVFPAQVPFRVGGHVTSATATNVFNGLVDEVRYSDRALTAGELLISSAVGPQITAQPHSAEIALSNNATFTVTASGTAPLAYQWYQGTTLLAGATTSALVVSNATLAMSGNAYSVIVSNHVSTVTSDPAVLTVVDPSSPIIGHWRFEDSGNPGVDSSSNGVQLANSGAPVTAALPDPLSGEAGALFPRIIAGQANANALQLDATSWLYRAGGAAVSVRTQLTVEAFFNASYAALNEFMPLASQYEEPGNKRSWVFGMREKTEGMGVLQLRFGVSRDGSFSGSGSFWIMSADRWTLSPGKDYYAAVVFDAGTVTFYLADLSSPTPVLQSQTYNTPVSELFVTSADFRVGGVRLDTGNAAFPGMIDDVRVARVALPPSQFLKLPANEPSVETPPQDTTVARYANATFKVFALGAEPLGYQWFTGTTPIAGATAATLVLTNVAMEHSGQSYYAIVTNMYGSATSSPALLTVVDTSGSTIGYWRFESTSPLGLDSSGYGLDLADNGSPARVSLPAGGPGAYFPGKVPFTRQTNTGAMQLFDGSYQSRADSLSFRLQSQLTVEAYFNVSSNAPSGRMPIASQYDDTTSEKSWVFTLAQDGPVQRLRFVISRDGSVNSGPNFWAGNSTLSLTTNRDYYAAMVFDAGTLKLYLVDLSAANPVMQTETIATTVTAFFDAATDFRLGAFQNASGIAAFPGLLDEVRVSRVALPREYLLANWLAPRLSNIAMQSGSVLITGAGAPGGVYIGQRSTDLLNWSDIAPNVVADSLGNLQFTDSTPLGLNGFYRLRQP